MRSISVGVDIDQKALDEIINELLEASNEMDDLNSDLRQFALDIKSQILRGNYKNQSGNLRRRLRVFVENNTLKIKMLEYGYYLSFGTRKNAKTPLTEEVASIFNKRPKSYFDTPDNNKGIAAKNFYPRNIESLLIERLEAIIGE